jgi:hypothetical protein
LNTADSKKQPVPANNPSVEGASISLLNAASRKRSRHVAEVEAEPEIVLEPPRRAKKSSRKAGFTGRQRDWPHLKLTTKQRLALDAPGMEYDRDKYFVIAKPLNGLRRHRYEPVSGIWEDLLPESVRPSCKPLNEKKAETYEQRSLFASDPTFVENARQFAEESIELGERLGKQDLMALLWGELDVNLSSSSGRSLLLTIPIPVSKEASPDARAGRAARRRR